MDMHRYPAEQEARDITQNTNECESLLCQFSSYEISLSNEQCEERKAEMTARTRMK
jgi:hypothetical protein